MLWGAEASTGCEYVHDEIHDALHDNEGVACRMGRYTALVRRYCRHLAQ